MIFVSTRGHGRAIGFERSHAVEMVETVRIELTTLPPEGSAFPLRHVSVVAVGGLEPPRAVYETAALNPWATPHDRSRVRELNPQCVARG